MRSASEYLASLRDGRAIFLDGERVADVTAHPAFSESIRRIAERYDATLRVAENRGHMVIVEPGWEKLAADVERWIREHT